MGVDEALVTLERIGSEQWSLVTTAQAKRAGIERLRLSRLADGGGLERVRRGVYALPSASYDPHQDLKAAWLATVPDLTVDERAEEIDFVVSHQSAASVLGLGNLIPDKHELTAPVRRQTSQSDLKLYQSSIDDGDIMHVDGLPVTSPTRTVVDLATQSVDFDYLAYLIRDALGDVGTTQGDLAERLNPFARKYHFKTGQELVAEALNVAGLPEAIRKWSELTGVQSAFSALSAHYAESLSEAWTPIFAEIGARAAASFNETLMPKLKEQLVPVSEELAQSILKALKNSMRPFLDLKISTNMRSLMASRAGQSQRNSSGGNTLELVAVQESSEIQGMPTGVDKSESSLLESEETSPEKESQDSDLTEDGNVEN